MGMGFSETCQLRGVWRYQNKRTRISESLRPFIFYTMKKILTLIFLSVFCLNAINAEVTWNLSDDGTLTISGTGTVFYNHKYSKGDIKKIIIESGVKNIAGTVFCDCEALTSVTIGNSVTSIGDEAFKNCKALTSISIPNSVTTMGTSVFEDCTGLTSAIIGNSLTAVEHYTFKNCTSLTSVTFGSSITRIKSCSFQNTGLTSITIPSPVANIEQSAFYGCSALTSVTFTNSVTDINSRAFSNCPNLKEVVYAEGCTTTVRTYLTGATSITIPKTVTSIANDAFCDFKELASIKIPNSVTSIGSRAFRNSSALKSISIPNSVTSIGEGAFDGCSGLISLSIGNSVTSIGRGAFIDCYSLTSITIPNSVTSIGEEAFKGCSDLNSLSIGNSVTSIGMSTFEGCSGLISLSIGNSVTSIGGYAFSGCSSLTSITIPNSVTVIFDRAFKGCSGLRTLAIPNSVTLIGRNAFEGCSGLTSITLSNSLTTIDIMTFSGCSGLTSITIPNSVTRIGQFAFENCYNLTSITCEAITPPKMYDSFYNVDKSTPVYVPVGCVEKYKVANRWNEFTNIIDNQLIANPVIAKIDAIGDVELSFECEDKIDEAIAAYEALTDAQKALVSNYDILTTAIETYETLRTAAEKRYTDKVRSDAVIARINLIGRVEYTEYVKSMIDKAITAYNALTDDQKALVTNYDVLITAKLSYDKLAADNAKADAVKTKINAIGKVEYTDVCKGMIDDASTAYEALTDEQKFLVANRSILTTAKQTYETLKAAAEKLAADKAKADSVIAKINAIGNVEYTDACKGKIDDASTAYNALTDDQKALVTNLDILTTARQTYEDLNAAAEKLAADKAKADAVIAKITAIGNVEYTDACKGKIDDASNAYDALTDDQKSLVTNLEVLTTARQTYNTLKAADDELMAYKAAFENYKSELRAIIEALGKEDDSDAVRDIINKAISNIDALEYDVTISLDDNKAKVLSFVNSVDEAVENQRAEDQKASGIEELELAEKVNIYDLSGKKITRSMLKSGLYIRNGKKVLIK